MTLSNEQKLRINAEKYILACKSTKTLNPAKHAFFKKTQDVLAYHLNEFNNGNTQSESTLRGIVSMLSFQSKLKLAKKGNIITGFYTTPEFEDIFLNHTIKEVINEQYEKINKTELTK